MRLRGAALTVLVPFLAGLLGCGGPSGAAVEGTVTYDGAPIDNGSILFVPDPKGDKAGYGTSIKDGKYSIAAAQGPPPGKYKVEITWTKAAAGRKVDPDQTGGANEKQVLPEKFNKATTLTAEIKSGSNKVDFPLTSK